MGECEVGCGSIVYDQGQEQELREICDPNSPAAGLVQKDAGWWGDRSGAQGFWKQGRLQNTKEAV